MLRMSSLPWKHIIINNILKMKIYNKHGRTRQYVYRNPTNWSVTLLVNWQAIDPSSWFYIFCITRLAIYLPVPSDNSAALFLAIPLNQNLSISWWLCWSRERSKTKQPSRCSKGVWSWWTSRSGEAPAAEDPRILPWSRWSATTANDRATRTEYVQDKRRRKGASRRVRAHSHRLLAAPTATWAPPGPSSVVPSLSPSLAAPDARARRRRAAAVAPDPDRLPMRPDPTRPSWRASRMRLPLFLTVTGHFFFFFYNRSHIYLFVCVCVCRNTHTSLATLDEFIYSYL